MSKKETAFYIIGNFLGSLAICLLWLAVCIVFKYPVAGIILLSVTLICLFIAIYIHEWLLKQENVKVKEEYEAYLKSTKEQEEQTRELEEQELEERKKEYESYLDAKTALLIEAFSILTDKRTRKETKAKKLRKIIQSDIFNI